MKTYSIANYFTVFYPFNSPSFEDAYFQTGLSYSLQHLIDKEKIEEEKAYDALSKSIQICDLAGVNSKHHFKRIYLADASLSTLQIEWLMSKKGLNLVIMQIPKLNKKKAKWLWQLANTD